MALTSPLSVVKPNVDAIYKMRVSGFTMSIHKLAVLYVGISLRVDTYLCLAIQTNYMTGAIAPLRDAKPILQTSPSVIY